MASQNCVPILYTGISKLINVFKKAVREPVLSGGHVLLIRMPPVGANPIFRTTAC